MTQEMLCAGTTRNIADYITRCGFPADAFLLLEKLPQQVVSDDQRQDLLCFTRLGDKDIDLASFTSGRVFSGAFELRWEQDAGVARVVYLGEKRELPALEGRRDDTFSLADKKTYYLFGARLREADLDKMGIQPDGKEATYYAELRVPRLLRYPLATRRRRMQLVVGEYHDAKQETRLFRFLNVQPVEEEEPV